MFTNDVREAKQEEIKMEGVDPDALKALVRYAYTGNSSSITDIVVVKGNKNLSSAFLLLLFHIAPKYTCDSCICDVNLSLERMNKYYWFI